MLIRVQGVYQMLDGVVACNSAAAVEGDLGGVAPMRLERHYLYALRSLPIIVLGPRSRSVQPAPETSGRVRSTWVGSSSRPALETGCRRAAASRIGVEV